MSAFSESFAEAREKFGEAATAAGALLDSMPHPQAGPDGASLAVDYAWIGAEGAAKVIVLVSGTHGVEGFFGSAVQTEWLRRREFALLPKGTAALLVHAINPYGFAWQRRVNEDNVDLNRNWVDFTKPLRANSTYDELADDLCPKDWDEEAQNRTRGRLRTWIGTHGLFALQQAAQGGQWNHPKGLFYGGDKPSWSRLALSQILQSRLAQATRIVILDFHTGLGPFGYVEPIIHWARKQPGFSRTRGWIGAAAKSVRPENAVETGKADNAVAADVTGDWISAVPNLLPNAEIDGVSLECGILPMLDVLDALRAENWLYAHGNSRVQDAASIKAKMRAAFYSDDTMWRGMALGQGLATCRAALGAFG
jgi:predicted deacylase